jgi:hypothetical protein
MRGVDLRRRNHVLLQLVVLERNAERASTMWNVYVHKALQEIHMSSVKVSKSEYFVRVYCSEHSVISTSYLCLKVTCCSTNCSIFFENSTRILLHKLLIFNNHCNCHVFIIVKLCGLGLSCKLFQIGL